MAWVTITEANVTNGRISAAEIAKINSLANDGDTISDLIPVVSRYVVGFIPRESPIGLAGTIPDELLDAACVIIAHRFLSQIGGGSLITEARAKALERAENFLKGAVARGDFRIVPPDTCAPEQATTPSPHIQPRPKRFGYREESGA